MQQGDRIRIEGSTAASYNGREGEFVRVTSATGALVKLDGDKPNRFFELAAIRKVNTNMSIASRIKTALAAFIATAKPTTTEAAVRELCAANLLCTAATAAKTRAKKQLVALGIILDEYRPGTITAFENTEFLVQAVTKEPSERLDQADLLQNMINAGLSRTRAQRVIADSMKQSKAATSIVVTEK